MTVAALAWVDALIPLQLFTNPAAIGSRQRRPYSVKRLQFRCAVGTQAVVIGHFDFVLAAAVQDGVLHLRRKIGEGSLHIDSVMGGEASKRLLVVGRRTIRPRRYCTLCKALLSSGTTMDGSKYIVVPNPSQLGHAPNGLLNEKAGFDFIDREADTGQAKRAEKIVFRIVRVLGDRQSVGQLEGGLNEFAKRVSKLASRRHDRRLSRYRVSWSLSSLGRSICRLLRRSSRAETPSFGNPSA